MNFYYSKNIFKLNINCLNRFGEWQSIKNLELHNLIKIQIKMIWYIQQIKQN